MTWTLLTGLGTLSGSGLYTPPYASGSTSILAASGNYSTAANITYSSEAEWNAATQGVPGSSWTTSGNWEDATTSATLAAPGVRGLTGDTVLFASAAAELTATLDGASPALAGITFNNATSSYTIGQGTGGSLTLQGGYPLAGGGATVSVLAGSHTISAPLNLASNTTFSAAATGSLYVTGPIDGSGSLTMSGGGTLYLSGSNSYSGGTVVSSGTIIVTAPVALPNGSNLSIGANVATAFGSVIAATASPASTAAPAVAAIPPAAAAAQSGPASTVQRSNETATSLAAAKISAMGHVFSVGAYDAANQAAIRRQHAGDLVQLEQTSKALGSAGQDDRGIRSLAALDAVLTEYGRDRVTLCQRLDDALHVEHAAAPGAAAKPL